MFNFSASTHKGTDTVHKSKTQIHAICITDFGPSRESTAYSSFRMRGQKRNGLENKCKILKQLSSSHAHIQTQTAESSRNSFPNPCHVESSSLALTKMGHVMGGKKAESAFEHARHKED